ncbi:MAG: BolA/IbaG family iron-sulfur metabolism protein [Gammaproteobacteria bacterium]|nr:MAG: BolA/IbaG family iron-sulfur metabolism protein [Gammaproteobacteria bacterium]
MRIQQAIQNTLKQHFDVTHLEVINESDRHNVPPGSESHFKVVIVSGDFEGKRQVQRHQAVYRQLAGLLDGTVHALALHTYTPQEWLELGHAPASPDCMGGGKKKEISK